VKNKGVVTQALVDAAEHVALAVQNAERYRTELTRRGCKLKEWPAHAQLAAIAEWFVVQQKSSEAPKHLVESVPDLPVSPTRASQRLSPMPEHTGPWFSMSELADRWRCAESTARRVLRMNGCTVLDFAQRGQKGKKLIRKSTIEQLEIRRTKQLR
jgi:hypothetical protein